MGLWSFRHRRSRVVPQVARDAIYSGHRYAAEEAVAAGLADSMAEEAELLDAAKAKAESLAGKGRDIFRALKRTLNAEAAKGFGIEI